MRRARTGTAMTVLGICFLALAAALVLYNVRDARRAEEAAQEVLEKLIAQSGDSGGDDRTEGPGGAPGRQTAAGERDLTMPVEMIDGYAYIGILEIPSLKLQLPVMEEWDYSRLKISPCRYTGNYNTDDLVICAHNYARHFSPIKWIEPGAEVLFTTTDRRVFRYVVEYRETLQPTAVEQLVENDNNTVPGATNADWDLTLFTCNTGGQTRCAVRCIRTEQEN